MNSKDVNLQILLMQVITFTGFIAMSLPYPILAPLFVGKLHPQDYMVAYWHILPTTIISIVMGSYPLGVFLGSIGLSRISDRYNKKKILLYTLFLASLAQLASAYVVIIHKIQWLIFTRFLSGTCEGNIAIARSIVALICHNEEHRKNGFGKLNAALTLGWMLGPLLGAVLANHINLFNSKESSPFIFSAIITFGSWLIVKIYFKPLFHISKNYTENSNKKANMLNNSVILLLVCNFFLTMGIDAFYQFIPIFLAGKLLLNSFYLALASCILSTFNILSNLYLISLIGKRISTINLILSSGCLLSLCLLLLGQTWIKTPVFLLLPFIGLSIAIITTNTSTLISIQIEDKIQGKLMGTMLGLRTLGAAIICFSLSPFIEVVYRLPFIIGSFLILTSCMVLKWHQTSNLRALSSNYLVNRQ